MNKKCLNCKIEYTSTMVKLQYCDYICKKARNKKWLNSLYRNKTGFLRELVDKNLRAY